MKNNGICVFLSKFRSVPCSLPVLCKQNSRGRTFFLDKTREHYVVVFILDDILKKKRIALNQTGEHKLRIYGLSLDDGDLIYDIYTPFIVTRPIPLPLRIAVDPESGEILVQGREDDQNDHIYRVDVKNDKWTKIATIQRSGGQIEYIGTGCYNPDNKVFYTEFANPTSKTFWIFGVDVDTGKTVITINNTENMMTSFKYDPKTKKVLGLGEHKINATERHISLLTIDSDHKVERVFDIPPYEGQMDMYGALDVMDRMMYATMVIFVEEKGEMKTEYHFVGFNIETGKVIHDIECGGQSPNPKCFKCLSYCN